MSLEGTWGLVLSWEGKETGVEEHRRDFLFPLRCLSWSLGCTMGGHHGWVPAFEEGHGCGLPQSDENPRAAAT